MQETSITINNSSLSVSSFKTFQEIVMFTNAFPEFVCLNEFSKPDHLILNSSSPIIEKHFILFSIIQQPTFPFQVLFVCADSDDYEQWKSVFEDTLIGLPQHEKDHILSFFDLIELENLIEQYPFTPVIGNIPNLQSLLISMLQGKETHLKQVIKQKLPLRCHTELCEFGFVAQPLLREEDNLKASRIYTTRYELVVSCGSNPCYFVSVFALNAICRNKLWLTPPPIDFDDAMMKYMWTLLMYLSTSEHSHFYVKNNTTCDYMMDELFKTFLVVDMSEIGSLYISVIIRRPVLPVEEKKQKRQRTVVQIDPPKDISVQQYVIACFLREPGYMNIALDFAPNYQPLYQQELQRGDTNIEVLLIYSSVPHNEHKNFALQHLLINRCSDVERVVVVDYLREIRYFFPETPFKFASDVECVALFNSKAYGNYRYILPFPDDLKYISGINVSEFLRSASSITFIAFVDHADERYLSRLLHTKESQLSKNPHLHHLQHSKTLMQLTVNPMYEHPLKVEDTFIYSLAGPRKPVFITGQSFGNYLMPLFFEIMQKRLLAHSRLIFEKYYLFAKYRRTDYISEISEIPVHQEISRPKEQPEVLFRKVRDLQYFSLRYLVSKKNPGSPQFKQRIIQDFPMTYSEYFRFFKPEYIDLVACIRKPTTEIKNAHTASPSSSSPFAVSIPDLDAVTEIVRAVPLNPKMMLIIYSYNLTDTYFENRKNLHLWPRETPPKIASMLLLARTLNPQKVKLKISKSYQEGVLVGQVQSGSYVVIGILGRVGLLCLKRIILDVLRKKKRMHFSCFPAKYFSFFESNLLQYSFQIERQEFVSPFLKYVGKYCAIYVKPVDGPETITPRHSYVDIDDQACFHTQGTEQNEKSSELVEDA
jgi:hypothetical protein